MYYMMKRSIWLSLDDRLLSFKVASSRLCRFQFCMVRIESSVVDLKDRMFWASRLSSVLPI